MKKDQGFWPADVYMEGLDQYRGWFQGRPAHRRGLPPGWPRPPSKTCITGWTVDGEGKELYTSPWATGWTPMIL